MVGAARGSCGYTRPRSSQPREGPSSAVRAGRHGPMLQPKRSARVRSSSKQFDQTRDGPKRARATLWYRTANLRSRSDRWWSSMDWRSSVSSASLAARTFGSRPTCTSTARRAEQRERRDGARPLHDAHTSMGHSYIAAAYCTGGNWSRAAGLAAGGRPGALLGRTLFSSRSTLRIVFLMERCLPGPEALAGAPLGGLTLRPGLRTPPPRGEKRPRPPRPPLPPSRPPPRPPRPPRRPPGGPPCVMAAGRLPCASRRCGAETAKDPCQGEANSAHNRRSHILGAGRVAAAHPGTLSGESRASG
jgi:hypothetical protein